MFENVTGSTDAPVNSPGTSGGSPQGTSVAPGASVPTPPINPSSPTPQQPPQFPPFPGSEGYPFNMVQGVTPVPSQEPPVQDVQTGGTPEPAPKLDTPDWLKGFSEMEEQTKRNLEYLDGLAAAKEVKENPDSPFADAIEELRSQTLQLSQLLGQQKGTVEQKTSKAELALRQNAELEKSVKQLSTQLTQQQEAYNAQLKGMQVEMFRREQAARLNVDPQLLAGASETEIVENGRRLIAYGQQLQEQMRQQFLSQQPANAAQPQVPVVPPLPAQNFDVLQPMNLQRSPTVDTKLSHTDREALAKLPHDEWQKQRAALLASTGIK